MAKHGMNSKNHIGKTISKLRGFSGFFHRYNGQNCLVLMEGIVTFTFWAMQKEIKTLRGRLTRQIAFLPNEPDL